MAKQKFGLGSDTSCAEHSAGFESTRVESATMAERTASGQARRSSAWPSTFAMPATPAAYEQPTKPWNSTLPSLRRAGGADGEEARGSAEVRPVSHGEHT